MNDLQERKLQIPIMWGFGVCYLLPVSTMWQCSIRMGRLSYLEVQMEFKVADAFAMDKRPSP